MKTSNRRFLAMMAMLLMAILACNAPGGAVPTNTPYVITATEADQLDASPTPEASATSAVQAEAPTVTHTEEVVASATPEPTATPENTATQAPPTATAGPQCVVLQNLNLRSGPGVAYRDPIGFVLEDTIVVPTGYSPEGVPGGSWVLVTDSGKEGWIAAESNFISCNFDLDTLPSVDVDPPPPPPPPGSAQSSDAEGNCGNGNPDCKVVISSESFIRFKLLEDGEELTEADGVEQITFSVRKGSAGGDQVYSTEESVAAYCIFGGNSGCNSWPLDGNEYVWSTGKPVTEGEYFVEILATYNGDTIRWAATFTITLP